MRDGHLSEESLGRRYEQLRKARVDRIVRQSFQLGRVANIRNPCFVALRNLALQAVPSWAHRRWMQKLYEFPGADDIHQFAR
jgi:2-polyprenyl-6-methoxyphenol hydroxylase-like FAD-dependent oxidoreductase